MDLLAITGLFITALLAGVTAAAWSSDAPAPGPGQASLAQPSSLLRLSAVQQFGMPGDAKYIFCDVGDCPDRSTKHIAHSPTSLSPPLVLPPVIERPPDIARPPDALPAMDLLPPAPVKKPKPKHKRVVKPIAGIKCP